MYSIGIDADKNTLVVHVVNEEAERVDRARITCANVEGFRALLRKWSPGQAVVEACNLADWIADVIREEGLRFVLAHPAKVKLIAQTVKKTDRVDARILAELLARNYIPEAYLPTKEERQDRSLVRSHAWLAKEIRRAKTRVRSVLNRHNWRYEGGAKGLFTQAGREWLEGLGLETGEKMEVTTALILLDAAEGERKRADQEIGKRARANPEIKRLRTIPGVGPLTALALLAILGDLSRFSSLDQIVAFVGVCPSVNQSGKRCHLGHITRAGDGFVRGLLVEAAWRLVRYDPHWHELFAGLAKRRGKKIAIVGIARRLLRVAVSMLRNGTDYDRTAIEQKTAQTAA